MDKTAPTITMDFDPGNADRLIVRLSGVWTLQTTVPAADPIKNRISESSGTVTAGFDTQDLIEWDSQFLVFIRKVLVLFETHRITVDKDGLPVGVRQLLALAAAVPEKKDSVAVEKKPSIFTRMGKKATDRWAAGLELIGFIGESVISFVKLFSGRAGFRRVDLFRLLQECGAEALPIVSLISILVGLILAFVGVIQLKLFGAQIYIADLVGIGMAREMGAMMTAIIMAGRTGAAFAAQLGTMTVNEEIDALSTMGISPMEFLVLPRMLALILMMPLLCLYADLMGIIGGMLVGSGMFDISAVRYYEQTRHAIDLMDLFVGLMKSGVFGVLVAIAGCYRGMQCGRSASAVGLAATSAVVTAIVFIVVSDAIMTVVCSVLDI